MDEETIKKNFKTYFIMVIVIAVILQIEILYVLNLQRTLGSQVISQKNETREVLDVLITGTNDLVLAVKALDRKTDDIQVQRYYSWVEANQYNFKKIPSCFLDQYSSDFSVFLVGDSVVKFTFGEYYQFVIGSDNSFKCFDTSTLNNDEVSCESLCAVPIGGGGVPDVDSEGNDLAQNSTKDMLDNQKEGNL